MTTYFQYWGKAQPRSEAGSAWHLLPFHALDVAAVGYELLARQPALRGALSQACGLDDAALQQWMPFFLALHDLGKFSEGFQKKRADIFEILAGRTPRKPDDLRHDSMGYLLWIEFLQDRFLEAGTPDGDSVGDLLAWGEAFGWWMLTVTGHHGQPPALPSKRVRHYFSREDLEAASAFLVACTDLFLTREAATALPRSPEPWANRLTVASWWLAGFAVLCDWLGSNQVFFSYHAEPQSLGSYWERVARPSAAKCVAAVGLLPVRPANFLGLRGLFPVIRQATPLQHVTESIPLASGAQMFLVEDVTGAGKTEAAFVLLNRLLAAGSVEGAYLALPTMATANAMYSRTAAVYRRLFEEGTHPSLVLAHSARGLVEGFRSSVIPVDGEMRRRYEGDYPTASAQCNAWLADNRKVALLAQIGVGTIDQALLAVLQARHQSLRLLGLRGKLLMVDEAHANDPYVHALLCRLLEFHAAAGGSAVILSATLPNRMRQELVNSFAAGLGAEPPEVATDAYPALTHIASTGAAIVPVDTRESSQRVLEFSRLADETEAVEWIVAEAEAGRAVAWVRNAVDDAIEGYRALVERLPPGSVTLFHARFALCDRLDLERSLLGAFGPDSGALDRQGKVVVATQVIEQSLDVDFDRMVSDLAPLDSLLQRAGRLQRHRRDGMGDRLGDDSMADGRGAAVLHVVSPEPVSDARQEWISSTLRRTGYVYPDHGKLWLTAERVFSGSLRIPEDVRPAIERVYSDVSAADVPDSLQDSSLSSEGKARADMSLAQFNVVELDGGYCMPDREWWSDSYTPTRLGEPSLTFRLARWDGVRLTPWAPRGPRAWQLSELRIPERLVADEEPSPDDESLANALAELRSQWADDLKVLVMIPDGTGDWHSTALSSDGKVLEVHYGPTGLRVERT